MGGVDMNIGFECKDCNHQQLEFMEQGTMEVGDEFDASDEVWRCKECKSHELKVVFVEKKW